MSPYDNTSESPAAGLSLFEGPAFEALQQDPAIGVSVVDTQGRVTFMSERARTLFAGAADGPIRGGRLHEMFPGDWVEDRLSQLRAIDGHPGPVILRGIEHGRSITTTCHPLDPHDAETRRFLLLSVSGDPSDHGGDNGTPVRHATVHNLGDLASLTRRELEVLAMIGEGLSRAAIAETLGRSSKTIDKHLESISSKLRVNNRVALAKLAHRAGLRPSDAANVKPRRTIG